jgi:CRISPR-associated endonuclease/helicase Cas3
MAHHSNLDIFNSFNLPKDFNQFSTNNKEYSPKNIEEVKEIIKFVKDKKLSFPLENGDFFDISQFNNNEKMFYIRMLFSCLVDADYCSSALFSDKDYLSKTTGIELKPKKLFNSLNKYRNNLIINSSKSIINDLRNKVFNDCVLSANKKPSFFTLSAPTGTAKTLAMLAFALKHAEIYNKKRIIFVVPYLSIIEQNIEIYKEICGEDYILEDDSQVEYDDITREYSQRWSSPIIFTTSVKLFETLFKSKSTDCRRLHSLANSIIVFDESHTLSGDFLNCSLEVLNLLVKNFNTTVVLSSATQPAYNSRKNLKIETTEIIDNPTKLYNDYSKSRKININFNLDKEQTLENIVDKMTLEKQTITIVNTRKTGLELFNLLVEKNNEEDCFYLSTNLCSKHKLDMIEEIKEKLKNGLPCKVVATQCIEAGVDLDFENLRRELGPYDSIVQGGGRCNRNGKTVGNIEIFKLKNPIFPTGKYYYNASQCVVQLYNKYKNIDINNLEIMEEYFKLLYGTITCEHDKKEILEDIKTLDFKKMSKDYKLIDNNQITVIVPYNKDIKNYKNIRDEIYRSNYNGCYHINKKIMKKSRKITVNSFDFKNINNNCIPLYFNVNGEDILSNWYLISDEKTSFYDNKVGLNFDNDTSLFLF